MIKVSPSILAADPLRLGEEAQRMVDAGCDWLHVDIMDGCFVPNLSYGPSLVKALRGRFSIPLDVHLMIAHPERYVETFIAAGADWLTIHAEAAEDLPALLGEIRRLGAHPSVSLKPATPAETIAEALPLCDMVLVMTVEPGFGGQRFMAEQIQKIRRLREMGYTGHIQADGGVSLGNLPLVREAGVDVRCWARPCTAPPIPGRIFPGYTPSPEGILSGKGGEAHARQQAPFSAVRPGEEEGHPAQAARAALKPQNMVVFDKVFPIYRKRVSLPPFGGILISQRR